MEDVEVIITSYTPGSSKHSWLAGKWGPRIESMYIFPMEKYRGCHSSHRYVIVDPRGVGSWFISPIYGTYITYNHLYTLSTILPLDRCEWNPYIRLAEKGNLGW